uniref:Retrovirus-related Pol polyprotein from transposon TNT 1-94-like beta-barrel domain-containing protein n=1 Tax=Trichogramma kaykai TaxID=54128 RepID=A0ABD2WP98_9HYME
MAGKISLKAEGRGSIIVHTYDGESWTLNHLANVLYVPDLQYNLFSANAALDRGMVEISHKFETRFTKHGKTIIIGKRKHEISKLFIMQI